MGIRDAVLGEADGVQKQIKREGGEWEMPRLLALLFPCVLWERSVPAKLQLISSDSSSDNL